MVLPTGSVPCNSHIRQMIKIVKPYIWNLVEDANLVCFIILENIPFSLTYHLLKHLLKLKMWISFLIPKIEDGNNFGVSIQEDMLAEIRTVESEAAAFFDQISRYFMTRGKIVTKVVSILETPYPLEPNLKFFAWKTGHEIPTCRGLQGDRGGAGRERVREPQVGDVRDSEPLFHPP